MLAAVTAVVVLATCDGGGGAPTSDADAGVGVDAGDSGVLEDGGARSPWRDSGPPDAGRDAGPAPTYRDAGLAHVRWETIPGLPDECVIERAVDPSEVYASRWEPCPGAEDYCQQLAIDYGFRTWRPWSARTGNQHAGTLGYWGMLLEYPDATPNVITLATTAGPPLLAYKYDGCGMSHAMNGRTIAQYVFARSGPEPRAFVYFGTIDEVSGLDRPDAVIDIEATGVVTLNEPALTPEQLVGVVDGAFLFSVRRTGETRRIDGLRPASGIQTPRLVGDHLLWHEYGSRWSLIHESADGRVAEFLAPPDADVRWFESDGTRMVWVQSYPPGGGASYTRHEIWTAAYVRDPTHVAGARRVLTVEDDRTPLAGGRLRGDRFAFTRRPEGRPFALDLLDLETGELRRFSLPAHREEMDPWVVYLSDSEAMVHTGGAGVRGLPMRIDLARMPVVAP